MTERYRPEFQLEHQQVLAFLSYGRVQIGNWKTMQIEQH